MTVRQEVCALINYHLRCVWYTCTVLPAALLSLKIMAGRQVLRSQSILLAVLLMWVIQSMRSKFRKHVWFLVPNSVSSNGRLRAGRRVFLATFNVTFYTSVAVGCVGHVQRVRMRRVQKCWWLCFRRSKRDSGHLITCMITGQTRTIWLAWLRGHEQFFELHFSPMHAGPDCGVSEVSRTIQVYFHRLK